jgi:8-oxo-dGTP pyrophosphatase MutT (NUDIX family)
LPKGKIDGDETPAEAAIREVEEECGINQLQIVSEPITTYHTYKMHNHRFLKITYWFKMTTTFSGNLIPQTEEQITEVKWENMSSKLLEELDTYESIKDLLVTVV